MHFGFVQIPRNQSRQVTGPEITVGISVSMYGFTSRRRSRCEWASQHLALNWQVGLVGYVPCRGSWKW